MKKFFCCMMLAVSHMFGMSNQQYNAIVFKYLEKKSNLSDCIKKYPDHDLVLQLRGFFEHEIFAADHNDIAKLLQVFGVSENSWAQQTVLLGNYGIYQGTALTQPYIWAPNVVNICKQLSILSKTAIGWDEQALTFIALRVTYNARMELRKELEVDACEIEQETDGMIFDEWFQYMCEPGDMLE